MNRMIAFLFCLISLSVVHGQSEEICYSLQSRRGDPGLRGPKGISGEKGAKGEITLNGSCVCDVEEIKKKILRILCVGGMIWNRTCVYTPGGWVNYDEAVRVCNSSGAELLKITDEKMYDVVYDYVKRNRVDSRTYQYFWLGMTFQPVNNPRHLITITPEWKITLNRWYPGLPRTGSSWWSWVRMIMQVRLRGESNDKGIYNVPPTYPYTPLCQYQL